MPENVSPSRVYKTQLDAVAYLKDAGYKGALSFETFNAIHVIDDELAQDALKFLGSVGRLFVKRIEE